MAMNQHSTVSLILSSTLSRNITLGKRKGTYMLAGDFFAKAMNWIGCVVEQEFWDGPSSLPFRASYLKFIWLWADDHNPG